MLCISKSFARETVMVGFVVVEAVGLRKNGNTLSLGKDIIELSAANRNNWLRGTKGNG